MLNKLLRMLRSYDMLQPGDTVTCAVSGGADSMALLFAMYLLKDKLEIRVRAAHFNHRLRGEESDRDEAFVRQFCDRYDIPLSVGSSEVTAGKKGLEAAAREARYAFFETLPGKIATAHTADDNAETVLMRMVRGTGLKGLGAITPVRDHLIRPMLLVTRQQVLAFLEEYHISYVEDSSNAADTFLRNRLRHQVMPLLKQENPRLAENLSSMALRLREDEAALSPDLDCSDGLSVADLRQMPGAVRSRAIGSFLESCGVREPEAAHIALTEELVFSENPSARADLPWGVTVCRSYDRLIRDMEKPPLEQMILPCPGQIEMPGMKVLCAPAQEVVNTKDTFTVSPVGNVVLRSRETGDAMRLPGGTKTLKKIFIDRKIPAQQRQYIPVVADDRGVLGVYGVGVNLDRVGDTLTIRFESVSEE